jgi:hypothetical protein
MKGSAHAHSHTKLGWGVWIAVVSGIWAVAFVFGSVIPSMGDFLSLLGAAFDVSSLPPPLVCSSDLTSPAEFLRFHLLGCRLLGLVQDRVVEGPRPFAQHRHPHRHVLLRPVPPRTRSLRCRRGEKRRFYSSPCPITC